MSGFTWTRSPAFPKAGKVVLKFRVLGDSRVSVPRDRPQWRGDSSGCVRENMLGKCLRGSGPGPAVQLGWRVGSREGDRDTR